MVLYGHFGTTEPDRIADKILSFRKNKKVQIPWAIEELDDL